MDNLNQPQANKKKRLWESSDSESEENFNNFPSFIVMESIEETPLSKISPFKIEKFLSRKLKPKTVKKLRNGTLLIEIYNKNQADEVLKWEYFDDLKIKTYPHNSLNTCKGVVKSHELSLCTLDEIKINLKNQNVTDVRRIQIRKNNGEKIDTNTYIITFNTHKTPKEIKIGYQKINVEPYIPNPLRCYKCQRFGHHQDQCTRTPVCGRCGENSIHDNCQKDLKCANCQENHSAGSRDCEIWKKEKEITKLKFTQNISYPEARKIVEATKYAEITKKNIPTTNKISCHNCETNTTTKPEVAAQLINEIRALIQEMKTIIRTVKDRSRYNSRTKTTPNKNRFEAMETKETKEIPHQNKDRGKTSTKAEDKKPKSSLKQKPNIELENKFETLENMETDDEFDAESTIKLNLRTPQKLQKNYKNKLKTVNTKAQNPSTSKNHP